MLSCITKEQESLYAPSCETKITRQMSNKKLLLCPNCLKRVIFCSGPKMGSYFRHFDDEACVGSYSEPETKKHRMGKEILYNWLKNTFKTSIVETEKHIKETNQIADILVTHTQGKIKGERWAFEFQHSNLSAQAWEERHNLYQKANITDFWILDADVFLKYSKSKDSYIQNSRLQKEPQEAIFSSTGFCYFLNLNTLELTIDYRFKYEDIREERANGGYYPKREIKLHTPLKHSGHISNIGFKYNEEFNFLAMCYNDIDDEFFIKFELEIQHLKREKEKQREKDLASKAIQKILLAKKQYGEVVSGCMSRFIRINKEAIQDDIFNLSEQAFLQKYGIYAQRLNKYGEEMLEWEDSSDITEQILYRLCNNTDEKNKITSLDFLENNNSTLRESCIEKFAKEIEIVKYVLKEYDSFLSKLTELNPIILKKSLNKINWKLTPNPPEPTKFDYGYHYHSIKSKEEVDEIVDEIKFRFSIRD
ncbi:competence protein CoiA [Bacillus toyonensis]|uniref:competence protein CoiA n=1 Tax=Bacillus toyonensis TaxID=155322 RepID=UPI002E23916F|nr:competence protein CoiA family protein [Bacillus toyonensis]